MSLSTVPPPPMSTYGCSAAPNIPTSPPKHLINWHLGPPDVPSSDTLPITKAIDVSISPPIPSLSPDMCVFYETDFPFAVLPRLTNDLDIFLQNNSRSAAPMPAPLPVPPLGFSFLHAAGSPTAAPGGLTMPPLLLAVQLPPPVVHPRLHRHWAVLLLAVLLRPPVVKPPAEQWLAVSPPPQVV
jgi:hypothetical protein